MAVTATVSQGVSGTQSSALDLGTLSFPFSTTASVAYATGTAAGQVDMVFTDTRTLSASGTEDLDLAGSLTGAFGNTLTFARIKAIHVSAAAGNTNNVVVTRPASNGVPWLLAAGDGIALRPGAAMTWASGSADATGVAVTAGTGDLITVTNSAGTTSVTYNVIILGCSA
ncbi:MAG: hypothetical protein JOY78_05460 [Pseudonocardia sp.]|nr:hypothetical protein [Pseudonocardia sp.]